MNTHDTDVRQRVLQAGMTLFASRPYSAISTRHIAAKAGCTSGMIRYYFGSKEGLFEAVFIECFRPLYLALVEPLKSGQREQIQPAILAFYQTMAKHPQLPKLILQIMSLPEDEVPRQKLTDALYHQELKAQFKQAFSTPKLLRPGVDPQLALLSLFSTLLFPFLIPSGILPLWSEALEPKRLESLARHTTNLLFQGVLRHND